jgi:hypothetical protein
MDWYYAEAGQQRGPVNETEFQNLIRAGTVKADTLVWREGMVNWQPYRDVAPAAGGSAPPPPNAPPQTFASPAAGYSSDQARQVALDKVNGPAIGLIVTAIFGFLATFAAMLYSLGGINFMPPDAAMDPNMQRIVRMLSGSLGLINVLIMAALSVLILVGALRMKKLRSYGLAVTGAIVALVPCISPCCVIGLPIGIWALVVLNKPEVKSQFP